MGITFLYLLVTYKVMILVLVQEQEGAEKQIYFISKV